MAERGRVADNDENNEDEGEGKDNEGEGDEYDDHETSGDDHCDYIVACSFQFKSDVRNQSADGPSRRVTLAAPRPHRIIDGHGRSIRVAAL